MLFWELFSGNESVNHLKQTEFSFILMNRFTEMNLTPERLIYYRSLFDCKFAYLICVNQKLIYHPKKTYETKLLL